MIDRLTTGLPQCRFSLVNERALQEGLAAYFDGEGIEYIREVPVTKLDRLDFLIGNVGVEVKIDSSPSEVTRQLHRYAECPRVAEILLITSRARHAAVPRELRGKPVRVIVLSGNFF